MTYEIDGYTPVDPKIATEIGVEFNYKTSLDETVAEFNFRAKSSGNANKAFEKAAAKLRNIRGVQAKTGFVQDSQESIKETLAVWFDHVILNWTHTVKSKGEPIPTTREGFINLLSMELFVPVFIQLSNDCADISNFRKQVEAKAVKNS